MSGRRSIITTRRSRLIRTLHLHGLDLSVGLRRREAWVLNLAQRYPEALQKVKEANQIEEGRTPGAHRTLAFIYETNGMHGQAIEEYQKATAIEGETTSGQCYLGYVLASAGRRREAYEILNRLRTSRQYVSPTELAGLYVTLGDNEGAIALLERALKSATSSYKPSR